MTEHAGRTARKRAVSRRVRLAATGLAAAFLVTGCVGDNGGDGGPGGSEGSEKPGGGSKPGADGKPLASTELTSLNYPVKLEVTGLKRTPEDLIFLEFRVTNVGSEPGDLYSALWRNQEGGDQMTPSAVTLIDAENKKLHRPLATTSGKCLCFNWDDPTIDPDEELDIWVAYAAPPKDVEKLDVQIPMAAPFFDIPISEGKASESTAGVTSDRRIYDLRLMQLDMESNTSREETGDETSIMLSADVLFELNEAKLTDKADAELKKVAGEIEGAKDKTVTIDGYTDSSGNDSINQPLSEARAATVEKKLKELVSRDDVTFKSAGHGSADPVADNESEVGRKKNRRVTVTFDK